jgi:hypothetical protein
VKYWKSQTTEVSLYTFSIRNFFSHPPTRLDYITTDIDGKGQIIYDSEVAMSLRKVYIGHVLRK